MSVSGNQYRKLSRIGFTPRQIRAFDQDQAQYITETYDAMSGADRNHFRTILSDMTAASAFLSTIIVTQPNPAKAFGPWTPRKEAGSPGSLLLNAPLCGVRP